MEKIDKEILEIKGAEGVVIHNGNIVLGMQKEERWYKSKDGKKAAIIKTIGGKIEEIDENSSKKALLRELNEEIEEFKTNNMKISDNPIFSKSITLSELNPYETKSKLKMTADFYFLEIFDKKDIEPNDLPAILEIPIDVFLNLKFAKENELNNLQEWVIKNKKYNLELPKYYALMIPEEIKSFLKGAVKNKKNSI